MGLRERELMESNFLSRSFEEYEVLLDSNTIHCHSSLIAVSSMYWYSKGKESPDSQTPVTELRSVAAKQKPSTIMITPK